MNRSVARWYFAALQTGLRYVVPGSFFLRKSTRHIARINELDGQKFEISILIVGS
jgi:hypothetical protein